jgi:hypothetical protein
MSVVWIRVISFLSARVISCVAERVCSTIESETKRVGRVGAEDRRKKK